MVVVISIDRRVYLSVERHFELLEKDRCYIGVGNTSSAVQHSISLYII